MLNMKISLFQFCVVFVCAALLRTAIAEDEAAFEMPDDVTLAKMRVKELKSILDRKGPKAECVACTSKQEYIERIHETESWPDLTPPPPPPSPDLDMDDEKTKEELAKLFSKNKDPKYMAELKAKLQAAGIDTKNIFTGDQINSEVLNNYKKYSPGAENDVAEDSKEGEAAGDGGEKEEL